MRADGIALCVSSTSEPLRGFCSTAEVSADFCLLTLSLVSMNAATAKAAPQTSAKAALRVVNPLPASPRRSPQTTDKLTNVIPAATHFMEIWRAPEKLQMPQKLPVML